MWISDRKNFADDALLEYSPSENYHKFLMKFLPSLPIRYDLIGCGKASNVDYGEENPTG